MVSLDEAAEAAPSAARAARTLASAAGSAGEICGERGASTHPFDPGTVFPLEVRDSSDERVRYNGSWLQHDSSSSSSNSSSSNDTTSDHDLWWDATRVGVLLRAFDPGKQHRRSTRREEAVLGVDLPFDRGKNGGECSMEGNGLRAEGETMDGRELTPSGMGSGVGLELYVDSEFASRDTNRRSVSGSVVMCAGACVSFFSRTQKKFTLSSTEAEYDALAAGIKETIFFTAYLEFYLPGPRRWVHFSQGG